MKKILTVLAAILIVAAVCIGLLGAQRGSAAVLPVIGEFFEAPAYTDGLPDVDLTHWSLKLVNADNPLPSDYEITTGLTDEQYLFDSRAVAALNEMIRAGRDEGLQLVLTSAYRTWAYQDMLFQDKVTRVIDETGLARTDAETQAAMEVARPGTSEHNLGLAADIVCEYYGTLDEGYADTSEAKWLREHCSEYGFILRYDEGKEDITGIKYEPWHFRYVGTDAAAYIMENDLCLEEFLDLCD